ncbi:MAG: peptide-methionine (S)-S-oxide reductase MsrA [Isosphaeraceae bacterium]
MTLRLLAASFATAAVLGLTTAAHAQTAEKEKPAAPGEAPVATAEPGADAASTEKADASKKKGPSVERATFGGGCFWCMEAVFERIKGVKDVVSGYAGGTVPNPTYEMVHSGLTGHAEVIQIVFDPKELPYEKLLNVFWSAHDPTTLNAQGDDFGPQYRSVIFYHSEAQRKAALASYEDLTRRRVFRSPIVTQLVPINNFYPAEPEHQNYYRNNRGSYYSQFYIDSKLKKLHLNAPTSKKKR